MSFRVFLASSFHVSACASLHLLCLVLYPALLIRETNLGPNDVKVAGTLHELARCIRESGQPKEAEPLFRRGKKKKRKSKGCTDHCQFESPNVKLFRSDCSEKMLVVGQSVLHANLAVFNVRGVHVQ